MGRRNDAGLRSTGHGKKPMRESALSPCVHVWCVPSSPIAVICCGTGASAWVGRVRTRCALTGRFTVKQERRLSLYEQHGAGFRRPAIASLVPPMFQSGQGVTNRHGLPTWDRPFCAPDDSLGALTIESARAGFGLAVPGLPRVSITRAPPTLAAVPRAVVLAGLLRHRRNACRRYRPSVFPDEPGWTCVAAMGG
jgi:hypothetical protein